MKAYTDLEQSKKLAEILPLESADMHWFGLIQDANGEEVKNPKYHVGIEPYKEHGGQMGVGFMKFDYIPCWSLAALLDVLPEGIIENYYAPNLQKENGKYSIAYGDDELLCIADNPIDACYEIIIKLYEQKIL